MRRTGLLLVAAALATFLAFAAVTIGRPERAEAALPADQGRIAFVRPMACTDPDEHFCDDVYTMGPDGSDVTQVTTDGWNLHNPMLSPDGQHIAFEQNRGPLRVINADGSGLHSVAPAISYSASWSADGSKVAYVADAGHGYYYDFENPDIFVANADGSGQHDLTNTPSPSYEGHPAFSPDGKKLAYACNGCPGSTGWDVYVTRADGSGTPRQITSTEAFREGQLRWSPNGEKIAFTAQYEDGSSPSRVYVMDADGSGMKPLVADPDTNWFADYPSWSPDGRHLIFKYGGDVYRVNADGTNPTNLGFYADEPNWQPNSAPFVERLRPAPGSTTMDRTPRVSAEVSDMQEELVKSGITTLTLDGKELRRMVFSYDSGTDRLSYTPPNALSYGHHTVRVVARDSAGATTTRRWSFSVVRR